MEIIEKIKIDDVRADQPAIIYYAARTCWWTHRREDLRRLPVSDAEIVRHAENFRLNSSTPEAPIDEFIERARQAVSGLPCDPRGSVLFMTDDVEGFLKTAERKASFYGKHGIRAFMAAHHGNCVKSLVDLSPWSATTWKEYNDALDRLDAGTN